jgi:hypothetical protein
VGIGPTIGGVVLQPIVSSIFMWSGGSAQVSVQALATPAHLPLISEAYPEMQPILTEGRAARATSRRRDAGWD